MSSSILPTVFPTTSSPAIVLVAPLAANDATQLLPAADTAQPPSLPVSLAYMPGNVSATAPLPAADPASVTGVAAYSQSGDKPPPPVSLGIPGDTEHLSHELVAYGWRRVWSHRERRFYFWNHHNNQSLWELPETQCAGETSTTIVAAADAACSASKRLALRSAECSANGALPTPGTDVAVNGESSTCHKQSLVVPLPVDISRIYSDFDITTNVLIYESAPVTWFLTPHPEIELLRAQSVNKLYTTFIEMCQSRQGIDSPDKLFGRWVYEQSIGGAKHVFIPDSHCYDPLLPFHPAFSNSTKSTSAKPFHDSPSSTNGSALPSTNLDNIIEDSLMFREIMEQLPMRLVKPKFTGEARKQLSRYCEAAKKMVESSRTATAESRKIVMWNVEDTFLWLRRTVGSSYDEFQERLTHLRTQCHSHLYDAARVPVHSICRKMLHASSEMAAKLYSQHEKLLRDHGVTELPVTLKVNTPRKVWCYPLPMYLPGIRSHTIEYLQDRQFMRLRYHNDTVRISCAHLQKLEHLYRIHCSEDRKLDHFLSRAWCLIKRYQTFTQAFQISSDRSKAFISKRDFYYSGAFGDLFNSVLPLSVMQCLNKNFGVTFELFSTPFSCYFRQYSSPFVDTDGYFGSRGCPFAFQPIYGSFVVLPPDSIDVIRRLERHLASLLHASDEPLSFICMLLRDAHTSVFLQSCQPPPHRLSTPSSTSSSAPSSIYLNHHATVGTHGTAVPLSCQPMIRRRITLLDMGCLYVQQQPTQGGGHALAVDPVNVFWLQNAAGNRRWTPTTERVDLLREAFRCEQSQGTAGPPVPADTAANTGCRPMVYDLSHPHAKQSD